MASKSVQDITSRASDRNERKRELKEARIIENERIEINMENLNGVTNETGLEIPDFILLKLFKVVAKNNYNVSKLTHTSIDTEYIKHNKKVYRIQFRIDNLYAEHPELIKESINLNVIKYEVN